MQLEVSHSAYLELSSASFPFYLRIVQVDVIERHRSANLDLYFHVNTVLPHSLPPLEGPLEAFG